MPPKLPLPLPARPLATRHWLWTSLLVIHCMPVGAQVQTGQFSTRISGEVLTYFSPYREFADQSLLTRTNGTSPIAFEADEAPSAAGPFTYRFLIGHSTGTSSGERDFEVYGNNQLLFVFHTVPNMPVGAVIQGSLSGSGGTFLFQSIEQDINRDAFGFLTITFAHPPVGKPVFRIIGRDHHSRDWLMVFMYREGWKMNVFPTSLVLRDSHKRQVNFSLDAPWPDSTALLIQSRFGHIAQRLQHGYQTFSIPLYPDLFEGKDTITCTVNGTVIDTRTVSLSPVRSFTFHIIHHSHNDIGYSHVQTEVARIQSANIRSAIRWIEAAGKRGRQVYWHIESLWAVENFMQSALRSEKEKLIRLVRQGNIVLSANYANVLTGLAQPEELQWMTEYARKLEKMWDIRVRNAMITDIPGISYWGLKSYTDQHIPYLSLGPNYIESLPDRGDRVGGVIRETGDKMYFWKSGNDSKDSVLVWTAGKGYSYFHNIQDNEKQFKWEQKLSRYVQELTDTRYPFDIVQLRYTKNADNGPVDTLLDRFVDHWNDRFVSPALVISSIDSLFPKFVELYRDQIPVINGGEISPYWEDGAYSTAREENQARELALKTIALEDWAKLYHKHDFADWYPLHRNLVMWHEHTWGAWCSISDPDIPFSTEQWRIKKEFLDSAQVQYNRIVNYFGYPESPGEVTNANAFEPILDLEADSLTGGLRFIRLGGGEIPFDTSRFAPFQLIYVEGTNHPTLTTPRTTHVETLSDDPHQKVIVVHSTQDYFPSIITTYSLDRDKRTLEIRYILNKRKNTNKESLHLCLPIHHESLEYGDGAYFLQYPRDQLTGSNREFLCTPHAIRLTDGRRQYLLESPDVSLFELGQPIDENKEKGAKEWKRQPQPTSPLFLYILNNYWHTNYKAYQEGEITFTLKLKVKR